MSAISPVESRATFRILERSNQFGASASRHTKIFLLPYERIQTAISSCYIEPYRLLLGFLRERDSSSNEVVWK